MGFYEKDMVFKCARCGRERYTHRTLYKCPSCKAMQPIVDYKKAFEDLYAQYEEDKQSAGETFGIMHQANEVYKKERNIYIITTLMCCITIIVQWLRLP